MASVHREIVIERVGRRGLGRARRRRRAAHAPRARLRHRLPARAGRARRHLRQRHGRARADRRRRCRSAGASPGRWSAAGSAITTRARRCSPKATARAASSGSPTSCPTSIAAAIAVDDRARPGGDEAPSRDRVRCLASSRGERMASRCRRRARGTHGRLSARRRARRGHRWRVRADGRRGGRRRARRPCRTGRASRRRRRSRRRAGSRSRRGLPARARRRRRAPRQRAGRRSSSPSRPTGACASAPTPGRASRRCRRARAAIGDTSVVVKRRFAIDDASAFGLEADATLPTARRGLGSGSGKPDWGLNAIYSADFAGAWHTDLNVAATRLGARRRRQRPHAVARSQRRCRDRSTSAGASSASSRARISAAPTTRASSSSPPATTSRKRLVLDAGAARSLRSGAPMLVGVHRLHLARRTRLLSGERTPSLAARLDRGHVDCQARCNHVQLKRRGHNMATYGKKASDKVEEAMHERKHGTLKSGGSGKKVTSRKQAIAIGLSEARSEGDKVPAQKGAAKKTGAKKSGGEEERRRQPPRRRRTKTNERRRSRRRARRRRRRRQKRRPRLAQGFRRGACQRRRGRRSRSGASPQSPGRCSRIIDAAPSDDDALVAERQPGVAARIVGAVEAVLADRLAAERRRADQDRGDVVGRLRVARTCGPCPRGSCACRG